MENYEPESLLTIGFIDGLTSDGEMNAAAASRSVLVFVAVVCFAHILPPVSMETGGFILKQRSWGIECKSIADASWTNARNIAGRDIFDICFDLFCTR